MESQLAVIFGKESDYKLCKGCNRLNWYENEECIECYKTEFKEVGKDIRKWIDDEYKFWVEEEKYSEEDADDVLVEV